MNEEIFKKKVAIYMACTSWPILIEFPFNIHSFFGANFIIHNFKWNWFNAKYSQYSSRWIDFQIQQLSYTFSKWIYWMLELNCICNWIFQLGIYEDLFLNMHCAFIFRVIIISHAILTRCNSMHIFVTFTL